MPAIAPRIRFEKVATDVGTYWRANASVAGLRSHLRSLMQSSLFKVASIGGSSEQEFEQAIGYIVALGQRTTASHNEAVLMSGSLGFSTLICLLNNGNNGQTETTANLLGPFWRLNSPRTENGMAIS